MDCTCALATDSMTAEAKSQKHLVVVMVAALLGLPIMNWMVSYGIFLPGLHS
jgi:predicted tellurium resistance membrane protein TerC